MDARALRAGLEPMSTGALDAIKTTLCDAARNLCRDRLEVGSVEGARLPWASSDRPAQGKEGSTLETRC